MKTMKPDVYELYLSNGDNIVKQGIALVQTILLSHTLLSYFEDKNYQICIVGTNQDSKSVIPILKNCKNLINNIDHSPPDIIYSISKISTLIVTNDTGPGHIAALSGNNILWLVNDNKVTKANIGNQPNNYKISSTYVNDITTQEVINFIEKKKLL